MDIHSVATLEDKARSSNGELLMPLSAKLSDSRMVTLNEAVAGELEEQTLDSPPYVTTLFAVA